MERAIRLHVYTMPIPLVEVQGDAIVARITRTNIDVKATFLFRKHAVQDHVLAVLRIRKHYSLPETFFEGFRCRPTNGLPRGGHQTFFSPTFDANATHSGWPH